MDRNSSEGEFTVALRTGSETLDYTPFMTHLATLSPSAADLAIRSLSPISNSSSSPSELVSFVNALASRLAEKRDYELVQAWMSVFLKLHSDSVLLDEGGELREALKRWKGEQEREGRRLGELVGYCGGVVGFLRGPR